MSFKSKRKSGKFQVQRNVFTTDGHRGTEPNWQVHIAEYACRLYARSGSLSRPELGEADIYSHRFDGGVADIKAGDRFVSADQAEFFLVVAAEPIAGPRGNHHIEGKLNKLPGRVYIEPSGGYGGGGGYGA